jgi:hypothetical protein
MTIGLTWRGTSSKAEKTEAEHETAVGRAEEDCDWAMIPSAMNRRGPANIVGLRAIPLTGPDRGGNV